MQAKPSKTRALIDRARYLADAAAEEAVALLPRCGESWGTTGVSPVSSPLTEREQILADGHRLLDWLASHPEAPVDQIRIVYTVDTTDDRVGYSTVQAVAAGMTEDVHQYSSTPVGAVADLTVGQARYSIGYHPSGGDSGE